MYTFFVTSKYFFHRIKFISISASVAAVKKKTLGFQLGLTNHKKIFFDYFFIKKSFPEYELYKKLIRIKLIISFPCFLCSYYRNFRLRVICGQKFR